MNPSSGSRQRCSMRKGVLKNFAKFIGKHLCLFLNKVAGLRRNIFAEHLRTTASALGVFRTLSNIYDGIFYKNT